jgi:uncharacterized membrane protein YdbT with pleckstrin-like domain
MSDQENIKVKMSIFVLLSYLIIGGLLCFIFIGFAILPIMILNYFTTSLVITKDSLIFKSGIIAKKERKIPFSKIHTVDSEENFIYKLLLQTIGKVKIYTGNDTSDISFDGISNPRKIAEIINIRLMNIDKRS